MIILKLPYKDALRCIARQPLVLVCASLLVRLPAAAQPVGNGGPPSSQAQAYSASKTGNPSNCAAPTTPLQRQIDNKVKTKLSIWHRINNQNVYRDGSLRP